MPRERVRIIINNLGNLTSNVVKQLTNDVHNELVKFNPRDTGFSANSWVPRVGSPDRSVAPRANTQEERRSAARVQEAKSSAGLTSVLVGYRIGQGDVFISNNTEYIQELDERGTPARLKTPAYNPYRETGARSNAEAAPVAGGWVQRAVNTAVNNFRARGL